MRRAQPAAFVLTHDGLGTAPVAVALPAGLGLGLAPAPSLAVGLGLRLGVHGLLVAAAGPGGALAARPPAAAAAALALAGRRLSGICGLGVGVGDRSCTAGSAGDGGLPLDGRLGTLDGGPLLAGGRRLAGGLLGLARRLFVLDVGALVAPATATAAAPAAAGRLVSGAAVLGLTRSLSRRLRRGLLCLGKLCRRGHLGWPSSRPGRRPCGVPGSGLGRSRLGRDSFWRSRFPGRGRLRRRGRRLRRLRAARAAALPRGGRGRGLGARARSLGRSGRSLAAGAGVSTAGLPPRRAATGPTGISGAVGRRPGPKTPVEYPSRGLEPCGCCGCCSGCWTPAAPRPPRRRASCAVCRRDCRGGAWAGCLRPARPRRPPSPCSRARRAPPPALRRARRSCFWPRQLLPPPHRTARRPVIPR